MKQSDAAIVALFLGGQGWQDYKDVARRMLDLRLAYTRAREFSQNVGAHLRERGRGHVEHLPGKTGEYKISARPEATEWCERIIKNYPEYFKKSYPQYFAPPEPPQPPAKLRKRGKPRQVDPLLRCKVEKAAVQKTTEHYRRLGYKVDSHEKDNVGWDLFATRESDQRRLEVKGLAGSETCVELTPNEYKQMQNWQGSYHVCVVTAALTNPKLTVFSYSPESGKWQDDDRKRTLRISEIVAARCSVD